MSWWQGLLAGFSLCTVGFSSWMLWDLRHAEFEPADPTVDESIPYVPVEVDFALWEQEYVKR